MSFSWTVKGKEVEDDVWEVEVDWKESAGRTCELGSSSCRANECS